MESKKQLRKADCTAENNIYISIPRDPAPLYCPLALAEKHLPSMGRIFASEI